ncbi:Homocysteine S-methyltransferase [Wallemia mellicola]|uniref:Homocysteine S-methyltransferase n=1 Tax=Wallemia mellicola TaxID=1708541 RepID=A0A4T0MGN6_9BASI|nr:Homocysteine S-methyltransferase [Wallemia mellicola]
MPELEILDGGGATQLETYNLDLTGSLWSASALNDNPDLVEQMHRDYLEAGADIIETCTYQVSLEGFKTKEATSSAIQKGVQVADNAINTHNEVDHSSQKQLAYALGPFAVATADGAEYTGEYGVDYSLTQGSLYNENLKQFHLGRLKVLNTQAKVNILLFETVPLLSEVRAIRAAVEEYRAYVKTSVPLYISLVFPDGSLPGSKIPSEGPSGIKDIIEAIFGGNSAEVAAIGINCTKPHYLRRLVSDIVDHLSTYKLNRKPKLMIYPDGGLVWDGKERVWRQPEHAHHADSSWAETVANAASIVANDAFSPFSGVIVGGCCKSGPKEIKQLRSICQTRGWL